MEAGMFVPQAWIDELFEMPELPMEWVEILNKAQTR
jgi:hypothetical protein